MNCPACNIELKMGDRQGVEVNYCPTCRGVWIERGGLDKIIDRASAISSRPPFETDRSREQGHDHDRQDQYQGHEQQGHRKKSFLSNLFD
jgi:Zn-finger nucleic acid-binding protein